MGMVVKCHPGVAVVAVDHRHPVRLVPLKTISFVPLTASLINQGMYKSIENETTKVTYVQLYVMHDWECILLHA